MAKFQDLTGQKFNHLTAKYRGENAKNGRAQWWCECDCGNPELVLIMASHLKDGHTTSCGCVQKNNASKRMKKFNRYEELEDCYKGYTSDGKYFLIDKEDYENVKDICWSFNDQGYLVSKTKGNKNIRLHRMIMGITDLSIFVDHIHGKETRYDNRKSNLRLATNQENLMNVGLQKNNTSGITGVCWSGEKQCWFAQITYNRKHYHLGYFKTKEEAAKARKEAEEKYFGELSYDNSQAM